MTRYTVSLGTTLRIPTVTVRNQQGEVVKRLYGLTWRRAHYRAIVWMRSNGGTR